MPAAGTDKIGVRGRAQVSVIIPTRDRADLLREALDSVFAQEGVGEQFDMEVIVVDDASSDATPEVVRRYSGVRSIRLPANRGVSAARNAGINASTGAYIAFLDDDDVWLPHRLKLQVPVLDRHSDAGLVYGQALIQSGSQEYIYPDARQAVSGSVFRALLRGNFLSTGCVLIRRSALEKAGLFDENLPTAEEWDLWLRLSFHFPFVFVPGIVMVYRRSPHGKHLAGVASGRYAQTLPRIVEKALALLPDGPADAAIKREARARMELNIAERLAHTQLAALARPRILAALRMRPDLVEDPEARLVIARTASLLAATSASPLATTKTFCEDLKRAAGGGGLRTRMSMRRLLAHVWSDVGVALSEGDGPRAAPEMAGYAAARAILYNPFLLRRMWARRIGAGARRP